MPAPTPDRLFRRHVRLAVVGLCFAGAAWSFVPDGLPLQWVVALHEGTTTHNVAHVQGDGHHGQLGYEAWTRLAGEAHSPRLPSLAALNLGMWLLALFGWWGVCWRISGSVWASLVVVCTALGSGPGLNAALSESTAALLISLGVAAVCAAAWTRPRDTSLSVKTASKQRIFGILAMFLLTCAATSVRYEMAVVLVPATLLAAAGVTITRPRRVKNAELWWRGLTPLKRRVLFVAALCTGFAALELWAALAEAVLPAPQSMRETWILSGIQAVKSHNAHYLIAIWLVIPGAVVALAVVGWLHALWHPVKWLGLPLTAPILASVYVAAAHGDEQGAWLEITRYMAPLLPITAVFAANGWGLAARWWRRGREGRDRRTAVVLAVAIFGAVPLSAWPETARTFNPWAPSIAESGVAAVPLDHDVQREVRGLLRTLRDRPTCAVAIPLDAGVEKRLFGRSSGQRRFEILTTHTAIQVAANKVDELVTLLAQHPVRALDPIVGGDCLLLWRGLDCNIANAAGGPNVGGCEELVDGRRPIWSERFVSRPYNHQAEYQWRPAETTLALYELVNRASTKTGQ